MSSQLMLTGMILESGPVNDYDRRLVILTKERGKITAFSRGARRVNNKMLACTNQFCFGNFKVFEGKTAYNISDAEIINYFEDLRLDYEGAYLGMYFLEVASYFTRENNDEIMMLKLLYQSVRAILNKSIDNKLIRSIFEIKSVVINGEFPGVNDNTQMSDTGKYTISYIVNSKIEKLYTFTVNENVIEELNDFSKKLIERTCDRKFKSLEMVDGIY